MGDINEILKVFDELSNSVARSPFEKQLVAQTITLKVKYADFKLILRSRTIDKPAQPASKITKLVKELVIKTEAGQERDIS